MVRGDKTDQQFLTLVSYKWSLLSKIKHVLRLQAGRTRKVLMTAGFNTGPIRKPNEGKSQRREDRAGGQTGGGDVTSE